LLLVLTCDITIDGKVQTYLESIEEVDNEKKKIIYKVFGTDDIDNHYRQGWTTGRIGSVRAQNSNPAQTTGEAYKFIPIQITQSL
jgi:hypothetical protein